MPNADAVIQYSNGGQYSATVAGQNGETTVYTGAGRLCQVCVVTTGTVVTSVYDGTNSTTGTLIFTSATNSPTGTLVATDWPISTGIVVKGSSTACLGLALSYNKSGNNGNA